MTPHRPLFSSNILAREVAKYRKAGVAPPAESVETIKRWHKMYIDRVLHRYTETQTEQAFNSAIFEKILGYKPIGSASVVTILPKKSGKASRDIPDFVLGTFNTQSKFERWRAVGEIKSVFVGLDQPQTSRANNETPVQQAFRYALNGKAGTEWVIVTNFAEIRLYRNGYSSTYHKWTLEELCDPERLSEFYVLLCQTHLAPEHGDSITLGIFEKSLKAGLALTEGFYGLYDIARRRLTAELCRHSAYKKIPLTESYGKAHKILNRILFAAFCEDHPAELLPEETLKYLHTQASSKKSLWTIFRRFFRELDKGSPPGASYAYNAFNGGLFAHDPLIDDIELPDTLFTQAISVKGIEINGIFGFHIFDFAEELGVEALGAIFEQSLKDLPHLELPVRGHGDTEVTRREATGVYYTSPAITNFMVSKALSVWLERTRLEIEEELSTITFKDKGKTTAREMREVRLQKSLIEKLRKLRLIDPACGSGAFLVMALRHLHAIYESANSTIEQLVGARELPLKGIDREILRKNLYGIDVLAESVEIARLSIWLYTAIKNEPLEKLDRIRCEDTLRSDEKNYYDIVVSNPPWGAELEGWTDDEILSRFPAIGEEKDSFSAFILRGFEMVKPGGILAYILPNSWLTVASYADLRGWILENVEILEIVHTWKIFKDVNNDTCILIGKKKRPTPNYSANIFSIPKGSEHAKWQYIAQNDWQDRFTTKPQQWKSESNHRFEVVYPPAQAREIDRVSANCLPLGQIANVTVGIQVYHQRKVSKEIIKERAFHSTIKKGPDWYPYIEGKQVQRYCESPGLGAFLYYNENLCDKRELEHYAQPRILVQQILWQRLSASMSNPLEPTMYLNTLFSVTAGEDEAVSLAYILGVLNSRFISSAYQRWTNHIFGDKFPKVSKIDLARLPIASTTKAIREGIAEAAISLSDLWPQLRTCVRDYLIWIEANKKFSPLSWPLKEFWTLNQVGLITTLQNHNIELSPTELKQFVSTWGTAIKAVNQIWSKIAKFEGQLESLVCQAYDMDRKLYKDLTGRVRPSDISDVLLGE